MIARQSAGERSAWYAVAVLTLANVSGFVDRQVLSLLVPAIERDLRISDTQMSYLIGLSFTVFYTVLGIPLARLADRTNRRTVMAVGVALWSVMTTLSGVAGTYPRLLLARIGVGVGEATLNAPAVALIADSFPRARVGTAMSVYSLGIFLGSGLAYFIGGWVVGLMTESASWRWPVVGGIRPWQSVFFAVGVPGLLVALLLLTIRDARPPASREAARRTGAAALLAWARANPRTVVAHHVGFALSATVNFAIAAWLATFLVRTYGWTPSRAGMVQGVLTMTIGVGAVVIGGRAADSMARRGVPGAPLRVGMIGAAGMLVSASLYPLMPTAWLAVGGLAIVNFFAAFPWGAASAAAAEIVPARLRAQGAALYFLVLNLLSGALGPTAVAVVTDSVFRDPSAVRYSLAIVNAVGMLAALALLAWGVGSYELTVQRAKATG